MTAEDPGSDPGLPRSCGPPLTRPRMTGPAAPGPWSRRSRTRLSTPSPFLPGPCLSVRTRPWRWRPGAPAPEATRLAAARSLPLALDRDAGHHAGLAPANGREKRTYPNVAGDRPSRMRCGSSWSHWRGRAYAEAIAVSRASCGFLEHGRRAGPLRFEMNDGDRHIGPFGLPNGGGGGLGLARGLEDGPQAGREVRGAGTCGDADTRRLRRLGGIIRGHAGASS